MAPDYYDYSVRKSGKIGAQRAALIYREPLKEGYSSGSLVINEVVLEGVFSEIRRPATQEDRPHGRCPFPYKGRRMSLLPYSDQAGRIFPPSSTATARSFSYILIHPTAAKKKGSSKNIVFSRALGGAPP